MKYILILALQLLATIAFCQCSEFNQLIINGDNYLKGNSPNYTEAINAYTAAIIACPERAGEAKRRINEMVSRINKLKDIAKTGEERAKDAKAISDSLFVEAEKQKNAAVQALNLAQIMKDSASKADELKLIAQNSLASLIILNDLEKLGDDEMNRKQFLSASNYYTDALHITEKIEIQDSSIINKTLLLTKKQATAKQLLASQSELQTCIAKNDSLISKGGISFEEAYKNYLSLKKNNYEQDSLKDKIWEMENYLEHNWRKIKWSNGKNFRNILYTSAEGNLFIGRIPATKKRLQQLLFYYTQKELQPINLEFSKFDQAYSDKLLRRFSLYLSTRIQTGKIWLPIYKIEGYGKISNLEFFVQSRDENIVGQDLAGSLGVECRINNHLGVRVAFTIAGTFYPNNMVVDENLLLNKNNTLYGGDYTEKSSNNWSVLTFFTVPAKRLLPIKVDFFTGIETYSFVNGEEHSLIIQRESASKTGAYGYQDPINSKPSISYSEPNGIPQVRITSKIGRHYLNGILGTRISTQPFFKSNPKFGVFFEFGQFIPILPSRKLISNKINIKSRVANLVASDSNSPVSMQEANSYAESYWNYDVTISTKNWDKGTSFFSVGMSYGL